MNYDYYIQFIEALDALPVNVSDWEADFIASMLASPPSTFTEKQQEIVRRMALKYLNEVVQ